MDNFISETTNNKTSSALRIFLILILSGFLVTCAQTIPIINKDDISINHNIDSLSYLDDAQVIIHMLPEDRKRIFTGSGPRRWRVKEGLIIESAAIKTFSKIFKNVKSSRDSEVSNLVITVSGNSHVNNHNGIFTAEANAIVSLANGEKLGKYNALGKSGHPLAFLYDENRLELVHVKAFVQILESMLKDEKLADYFKRGFGKMQTANFPE